MRNYIFLAIIIFLIAGAIAFLTFTKKGAKEVTTATGEKITTGLSEDQEVQTAEEGKNAPDFTLVDFEGNTVKLSDLKLHLHFRANDPGRRILHMPRSKLDYTLFGFQGSLVSFVSARV